MADHHSYGASSESKLDELHPDLVRVMRRAIKMTPPAVDLTIVWTYRNKQQQNSIPASNTNARWPESYHNAEDEDGNPCSEAVDFAPLINGKIPWKDDARFCHTAGIIHAAAQLEDVEIIWGNDFDQDGSTKDQSLADSGHIQRKNAAPRPPRED